MLNQPAARLRAGAPIGLIRQAAIEHRSAPLRLVDIDLVDGPFESVTALFKLILRLAGNQLSSAADQYRRLKPPQISEEFCRRALGLGATARKQLDLGCAFTAVMGR